MTFHLAFITGWLTVPAAALGALVLLGYWEIIGAADVPPSRRRIRRASIAVMLLLLPLIVAGASFVEPSQRQVAFVTIWCVVFIGVMVIVLFALLDVRNSLRLHVEHHREMVVRAAAELARRREAEGGESPLIEDSDVQDDEEHPP